MVLPGAKFMKTRGAAVISGFAFVESSVCTADAGGVRVVALGHKMRSPICEGVL